MLSVGAFKCSKVRKVDLMSLVVNKINQIQFLYPGRRCGMLCVANICQSVVSFDFPLKSIVITFDCGILGQFFPVYSFVKVFYSESDY